MYSTRARCFMPFSCFNIVLGRATSVENYSKYSEKNSIRKTPEIPNFSFSSLLHRQLVELGKFMSFFLFLPSHFFRFMRQKKCVILQPRIEFEIQHFQRERQCGKHKTGEREKCFSRIFFLFMLKLFWENPSITISLSTLANERKSDEVGQRIHLNLTIILRESADSSLLLGCRPFWQFAFSFFRSWSDNIMDCLCVAATSLSFSHDCQKRNNRNWQHDNSCGFCKSISLARHKVYVSIPFPLIFLIRVTSLFVSMFDFQPGDVLLHDSSCVWKVGKEMSHRERKYANNIMINSIFVRSKSLPGIKFDLSCRCHGERNAWRNWKLVGGERKRSESSRQQQQSETEEKTFLPA